MLKLNNLATWCKELTHWKRFWCWEGLGAGGEGDDRGWDGWMASPTRWTWVWVNSGSWWWTGRPGVLGFMGSQRVRHDWVTELNWIDSWFMLRFDRKQQTSVKQLSLNKKQISLKKYSKKEKKQKQRHHFTDKGPYSQSYGFSSSHVWMCELDHKEGWVLKNWCFWTMILDKTL